MADKFDLSFTPLLVAPNGCVLPMGRIHFYEKNSTDYAAVYGDPKLTVPLSQPVLADAAGHLPEIYLDSGIAYRAVISDKCGHPVYDLDDVNRQPCLITVISSIDKLRCYTGDDDFLLVVQDSGCPRFYRKDE